MAVPIEVGPFLFKTKKELTAYCREVLGHFAPGERIDDENAEFLHCLLQRHRSYPEKIGGGIAHFTVEENPQWGGKCFWLWRLNGTNSDFSFHECVTQSGPWQEVMSALRRQIVCQVLDFKTAWFSTNPEGVCPLTGEFMTRGSCHVDHVAPLTFLNLAIGFMASKKLTAEQIPISGKGDGQSRLFISDSILANEWEQYHKQNAILRILSPRGNTSIARKQVSA